MRTVNRARRAEIQRRAHDLRTTGQRANWPLARIAAQICQELPDVRPLEAWRLAYGWTRTQAVDGLVQVFDADGLRTTVNSAMLCRWEHGKIIPGPDYVTALLALYKTSAPQLGLATPATPHAATRGPQKQPGPLAGPSPADNAPALLATAPVSEEAAMRRRDALRAILAAAGSATLPAALLDQLDQVRGGMDQILVSSTVSAITLDRWETAADGYGYAFKTRPPRAVLEDALLDLGDLQLHAANRQTTGNQRRICRITAQLAGIAGNILTDLGHHRHARRWFATAQLAAEETGDPALNAWVRARESTVSLYHQQPPQTAIALAVEAQHHAGRIPCAGAALAAATEARAWARLGDTEQALTALRRAEQISAHLPRAELANSIYGYPTQQLAFHREATLTLVGSVREAQNAQHEALALYPKGEHVNPTLIRLDQAACAIRCGDRRSGYQMALHHLGAVPATHRTPLVLSRARELAHLPAAAAQPASSRTYLEAVDALAER